MSKWLYILDNAYSSDNNINNWAYNVLSNDISYVLIIYDLLLQILDPCLYITDNINSIEQLYNIPQSIITQSVAIYYSSVVVSHSY